MPRGRDMEHAGARVLPSALRASAEMEIFGEAEQDEKVIDRITAAQREEVEREIAGLEVEAREAEKEIEELVGSVPF
jgi:hypothetical protein